MSIAAAGSTTRTVVARAFSILGHPVVLTPIAAVLAAMTRGAPASEIHRIALLLAGIAAIVMSWSWLQVARGRWKHVDASTRGERRGLNLFLVAALLGCAPLAWIIGRPRVAIALVLSGVLVLVGLLSSRWLKISLHGAFAAFSTALVWPYYHWMITGVVVTGAVAWSRFALGRHVPSEIIAGVVLGALAGMAFHPLMAMRPG